MAYDPNDPKDKEIVQGLIDKALEDARADHDAEVERLSNKNTELLGKLRKARQSEGGESTVEIERLERELDETRHDLSEAQSKLRTTEREMKRVSEERDTAVNERDQERSLSHNELVENRLTASLAEANVAPHFMEAAKALLKGKTGVEMDGDNRLVKADGKDLGEFVKEWAASDAGKHYIQAPGNAGGGATGPNGNGNPNGGKKMADLSEAERLDMARNRPDEWKALQSAEEPNPNVIR